MSNNKTVAIATLTIGVAMVLAACGRPTVQPRFEAAAAEIEEDAVVAVQPTVDEPDEEEPSLTSEDVEKLRQSTRSFQDVFANVLEPGPRASNSTDSQNSRTIVSVTADGSAKEPTEFTADPNTDITGHTCRSTVMAAIGSGSELRVAPVGESVRVGEVTSVCVLLASTRSGLAGYDITLDTTSESVAQIVDVTVPPFGLVKIQPPPHLLPDGPVRIRAADLVDLVNTDSGPTLLATLKVRGIRQGSTSFKITVERIDDEKGLPIQVRQNTFPLKILPE